MSNTINLSNRIVQNPQPTILAPNNPRLQAAGGFTDLVSRIWKAFTDAIKSCLSCFGLFSKDNSIQEKLARQMQYSMDQMQQEPRGSFQYENAPANWNSHEEARQVGGYAVGISHAQGGRPTMEDEHLATSFNLTIGGKSYPVQLFGIFDGHGGRDVARYVRDNLQQKLQAAILEFNPGGFSDEGIWKALKKTTESLNRDLIQNFPAIANPQGSTATIAVILDNKLWTANVGDSRTVLDNAGAPIQLTEDAKPDMTRYKKGIEKRHGRVIWAGGGPRVNGRLAVARAIGDNVLNGAICARPKITMKPLSEIQQGSHLILCCDGIYDVARTQDVVSAVHANRMLPAVNLARNITYSAFNSGSGDNLSAMVIKIK